MKHWLIFVAVTTASCLLPHQSFAQGTDLGISGVGLVSIQPIDDAYVGSPYLSEGIGGLGPGFGAALNVIAPNGFVVVGEFSTARYSEELSGRLVEGCTLNTFCVAHTTTLRDSILSGLVGYANTDGRTRVQFVGGIGAKLDSPAVEGDPREPSETNHDRGLPFVLTGGFDVMQSVNARAALVVGARYAYAQRAENQRYLGIGPHILRVSAGMRVRLN
jgi:hypothetical protein